MVKRTYEGKVSCPFCCSVNTSPIWYGMPVFNDENDWEKVESGEIVLRGECTPFPRSGFFCRNCKKEFGNDTYLG